MLSNFSTTRPSILPERPRPPDPEEDETDQTEVRIFEREGPQKVKQNGWWPTLGKAEYIVLSLCWASYSIFNVVAYRNGGV